MGKLAEIVNEKDCEMNEGINCEGCEEINFLFLTFRLAISLFVVILDYSFHFITVQTDLLARSLIQLPEAGYQQANLPIPKIMMDGWHGPDHLVGSALNHDKVTIVTAGIGITAFLSMFTEMIEVLCFRKDGLFVKMDEIEGEPITKEFALHWSCRDENLIKYITDEYFQPLIEESERYGSSDDNFNGVRCVIHIHRTGEAGSKTLNPTSLWKSFRDKTERGLEEIDFGALGTFGSEWVPYRFSFGMYESFYKQIPSVVVFTTCIWFGWAGAQQMGFWLWPNSFGFPPQLRNLLRPLFFLPIILVSFGIAWIAHVMVDWSTNVESSKKNKSYNSSSNTAVSTILPPYYLRLQSQCTRLFVSSIRFVSIFSHNVFKFRILNYFRRSNYT